VAYSVIIVSKMLDFFTFRPFLQYKVPLINTKSIETAANTTATVKRVLNMVLSPLMFSIEF